MLIQFSRHAKRRLKLYNISEEDVVAIIKAEISNTSALSGKIEIIEKRYAEKYGYPLK